MKLGKEMEMAICVCMYNEDKDMLNNTLQGIGENIVQLYKQGVDPDKIVVVIVQDGIEKMDKSILPFV
jgi:precorrin-6B methylase 1